jgi:tyrosyl-tRNA synthetase
MEEIEKLAQLKDQEINIAKKILAFEVTKLVHGEEEALKAQKTAEALFTKGASTDDMPTTEIALQEISEGISIIDLLLKAKLITSKGEGRRLIEQGGIYVNDNRVEGFDRVINKEDLVNNELIIKKGKKVYHRVKPI